ncbi:MAG: hypothetical protein VB108_02170 [Anaerolineaceae bacterium]|nr:hypothetical protein [Anaerolineaceae bacterium]
MNLSQLIEKARRHFAVESAHKRSNEKMRARASEVAFHACSKNQAAVLFFETSTRLTGLSLNAAYSLLSSWSLSLQGVPVIHLFCDRAMRSCVLGTSRKENPSPPPCNACMAQSDTLYAEAEALRIQYHEDETLEKTLAPLALDGCLAFTYQGVPLGELITPSLRWILRRHNLEKEPVTLRIAKDYIRSAWSLTRQVGHVIDALKPQALVVFNGMQYPEASAKFIARQKGVKVVSHEVGLQPFSAFFTEGDATAYPLDLPDDFQLNDAQNARLDETLSCRFNGKFSMAGVRFWPEMSRLETTMLDDIAQFKQLVSVFTNVIFDTSQPHANVIFRDMFDWLDSLLELAKAHPETLFIIRAHPDESRKGKASEESVSAWAQKREIGKIWNMRFIPPEQFLSSYELIDRSKFVIVYNSTIGMEASIMGKMVLAGGKSRYSPYHTCLLPPSRSAYIQTFKDLLEAKAIKVPANYAENARRFLYYQLYRASLPFEVFIEEDGIWNGYVKLRDFEWQALMPENSPTMRAISEGILANGDFMLNDGER